MSLSEMLNEELFAYRYSLAMGSGPAYWTEDADRELAARGYRYEAGSIVKCTIGIEVDYPTLQLFLEDTGAMFMGHARMLFSGQQWVSEQLGYVRTAGGS